MTPLILNVYKPPGPSSADFLNKIKRQLGREVGKIGHFGTLDPFASGVLLVGIGGASRLMEQVHAWLPKTYVAVGKIGLKTATGDKTGEVLPFEGDCSSLAKMNKDELEGEFRTRFVGTYMQTPPAFSAAKHQGVPLYKLARKGIEIKKEAVERQVYSLEILRYQYPYVVLRATVSTGTYIRTLFTDGMQSLGACGALTALFRESIGPAHVRSGLRQADWSSILKGPWCMRPSELVSLSVANIEGQTLVRYRNGQAIDPQETRWEEGPLQTWQGGLALWVQENQGRLVGMGRLVENKIIPVFTWP